LTGAAESSLQPLRIVVAWQYVFTHPTSFRQRRIDSHAWVGEEPEATSAVSTHLPEYDAFTNVQVTRWGAGGAASWVLAGEDARSAAATSPERIALFMLFMLFTSRSNQKPEIPGTKPSAPGRFAIFACLPPFRTPVGRYSSRMARLLAVDFGEKRIGLATSDAAETLATPRLTLRRSSDDAAIAAIARFAEEEEIGSVVVGIPRSPEGVESPFGARIRGFAAKLASKTGLPVRFHEETLTSDEALRRLPPGSPREAVDRTAAAVLLEDFLSSAGAKSR